jgi:hypothetical protein
MHNCIQANYNTCIGYRSGNSTDVTGGNTCVGAQSIDPVVGGSLCTLIGYNSILSGATNTQAVAVGAKTTVTTNGVAIGYGATCTHLNAIAIGQGISTGAPNGVFIQHNTGAPSIAAHWSGNQLIEVTSSLRFKENIEPYNPDLNRFRLLRPVTYHHKNNHTRRGVGLIAEELHDLYPEYVNYEDDGITPRGISYDVIITLLISKIQQLEQEFNNLKNK